MKKNLMKPREGKRQNIHQQKKEDSRQYDSRCSEICEIWKSVSVDRFFHLDRRESHSVGHVALICDLFDEINEGQVNVPS